MELTIDSFNFDTMKEELGTDPFATTANKYAEDNRFYKLTKDKDGNGGAVIRFLPDSEKGLIEEVFRINTTIEKNGKKRFVNEITPSTIGLPCPFQEEWQRLWNSGDKEGSKRFGRSKKYITNIKVLKDPNNPANEGKIFLFEMSGKMKQMIQDALNPSQQDRDLGSTPKEMFNPLKGHSFRLVSKKGANDMINYDSSAILEKEDGIYSTVEEAIKDIKENTYKLSDLKKPENLLSYEELLKKFKWVTFQDTTESNTQSVSTQSVDTTSNNTPAQQTVVETQSTPAPQEVKKADSLDDLLSDLV